MAHKLIPIVALTLLAAPLAAQSSPPPPPPPPPPAPPPPASASGYGSWFGSIPDLSGAQPGILLNGVDDGSPAEKAGLKKGDLLVSMAGKPVVDLRAMVEVLRSHPPGDTIRVVFWRGEKKDTAKVVLGVRPGG